MNIKRLKMEVTINGVVVESYTPAVLTAGHYDILDGLKEKFEESSFISDWAVFDGEEKVAFKATVADVRAPELSTEPLKKKCLELYQEYNSYAQVAKLVGRHPTTVRTWINEMNGL